MQDISPDGSQLLVESFGCNPYEFNSATLWIAPVLGGSPRRVGDFLVGSAALSPDGEQLVFTREEERELDVCRIDGTNMRKLATVPGVASFPRWSPDGKKIRFSLRRNDVPERSLWEVSPDGRNLQALLPAWRDEQCCGNWTRDGRYFVFESSTKDLTTVWAIREAHGVLETTSRTPIRLTTGPMNTYGPISSLDGKRIFVGGRQPRIELVRYDSKNGNFVPFLSNISAEGLNFSRDGKWVAYVAHPEDTIWRSTVNGDQRLQLTFPPLHASMPEWSPDGRRITFMAFKHGGTEKIYVVNADGSSLQQLTYGEDNSDPTWSSDGNSIAFGGYPIDERQASRDMAIEILDLKSNRISVLPGSKGCGHNAGLQMDVIFPRYQPTRKHCSSLIFSLRDGRNWRKRISAMNCGLEIANT
ncbi:MAG: PD40 domain-containing protein [Acidobacteriaceae bacterium]|nr:PD40 domain-containing protein [Acidobacteriaceae bacterium]